MSDPERFRIFRRDGTPIADTLEWARLWEDLECRVVAQDDVVVPGCPAKGWVSTVWLGIDHAFGRRDGGGRRIFETLIEITGVESEIFARYATEDDARSGHLRARVEAERILGQLRDAS